MYRATQDARHLQRREGSFSTVPSARGVNLLGWEEPEDLTPDEQRKAIGRRVGQIQAFLAAHKDLGKEKWKLMKEMTRLVERMRKLKPAARAAVAKKDVPQHFVQVARERLTKPEFEIWLREARERARRPSGVRVDSARPSREHAELMLLAAADLESWMKSYRHDAATDRIVKRLRDAALGVGGGGDAKS